MAAKPFVVAPKDYAPVLNIVGEHVTVLASGEATEGYEVFLQRGPEGSGPPPHSHPWDESFFVVKGQIDFGIGARGTFGLPTTIPLEIIGSVDYFFPESVPGASVTYWEANANIVYMFQIPASPIAPYAGGGLNLAYGSVDLGIPGVDASSTLVGLNILGGAKFNRGPVTPFG